jgi:hypothetical protein
MVARTLPPLPGCPWCGGPITFGQGGTLSRWVLRREVRGAVTLVRFDNWNEAPSECTCPGMGHSLFTCVNEQINFGYSWDCPDVKLGMATAEGGDLYLVSFAGRDEMTVRIVGPLGPMDGTTRRLPVVATMMSGAGPKQGAKIAVAECSRRGWPFKATPEGQALLS